MIFLSICSTLNFFTKSILTSGSKRTYLSNLRLAGNDHHKIKQASGHKTDSVFQRYNLVTEEEMKGMQWLDQQEGKSGTIDTYMDTTAKTNTL